MMNTNSMKNTLLYILCIVLIAAIALFATGCNDSTNPNGDSTPSTSATSPGDTESPTPDDVTVKGEGKTSFYFHVTDLDGAVTKFQVNTDKTIVGEALLELGLISGEEGDYGLYVTAVNGITADWATENAYWAFYIDGEYALTGVDSAEIVPGTTYGFVKTSSTG